MTRSQVRVTSRLIGAVLIGVCCVLAMQWAKAGSSGARSSPPPPTVRSGTVPVLPAAFAAPDAPLSGRSTVFDGLPSVGALFATDADGHSTHHHSCTATAVASPVGSIVVTAAHCLSDPANGVPATPTAPVLFVPGYHDGVEPYGEWAADQVLVDPHWAADSDPDYDVAFVLVHRVGEPAERLADVVGAQKLGFGRARPVAVGSVGYPIDTEKPVSCHNTLTARSATQSEFDCTGFQAGSSGGPMLADVDPATGLGTLVGVIGGYQQGGDTPDVSYACAFGSAVQALYAQAVAAAS
ncbi:trypsin-like serine peptidase [Streptacidiphilus cavernicola]|uniref:Serine protease n=1 Tax=Streptacidiphilus cavernicola TaxID=3342716 RepID=A0ABV6VRW2_9ACTN